MVYTGTYIDENGVGHEISLTEEDSIEALKNDRDALLRRYNTQRVTVRQVKAQEGEAMRFQLTLHAPTHYLTSEDDTEPKPCDEMTFPGLRLRLPSGEESCELPTLREFTELSEENRELFQRKMGEVPDLSDPSNIPHAAPSDFVDSEDDQELRGYEYMYEATVGRKVSRVLTLGLNYKQGDFEFGKAREVSFVVQFGI